MYRIYRMLRTSRVQSAVSSKLLTPLPACAMGVDLTVVSPLDHPLDSQIGNRDAYQWGDYLMAPRVAALQRPLLCPFH